MATARRCSDIYRERFMGDAAYADAIMSLCACVCVSYVLRLVRTPAIGADASCFSLSPPFPRQPQLARPWLGSPLPSSRPLRRSRGRARRAHQCRAAPALRAPPAHTTSPSCPRRRIASTPCSRAPARWGASASTCGRRATVRPRSRSSPWPCATTRHRSWEAPGGQQRGSLGEVWVWRGAPGGVAQSQERWGRPEILVSKLALRARLVPRTGSGLAESAL